MRPVEDKGCLSNGTTPETSFEFQKSSGSGTMNINRASHHRTALGKPTPSKWDDAQKWLVNLSRGEKNQTANNKASPRNSNADDRRLIAPVPKRDYSSGEEECNPNDVVETKNVDCDESVWRSDKPVSSPISAVRPICLRDMGTEMTPIASQEPSRSATPVRVISPVSSGSSTPVMRCQNVAQTVTEKRAEFVAQLNEESKSGVTTSVQVKDVDQSTKKMGPLENRALAWDEAERAKYMARYKREEVKIQAWENHEKRKAEMENRKAEVKAERLKSRAQEKYNSRMAATRRIAEEKRANAEAKLNDNGNKTTERANYMRRTGHLPSSFSFKLPSFCF